MIVLTAAQCVTLAELAASGYDVEIKPIEDTDGLVATFRPTGASYLVTHYVRGDGSTAFRAIHNEPQADHIVKRVEERAAERFESTREWGNREHSLIGRLREQDRLTIENAVTL